jgi:hypothetical protein
VRAGWSAWCCWDVRLGSAVLEGHGLLICRKPPGDAGASMRLRWMGSNQAAHGTPQLPAPQPQSLPVLLHQPALQAQPAGQTSPLWPTDIKLGAVSTASAARAVNSPAAAKITRPKSVALNSLMGRRSAPGVCPGHCTLFTWPCARPPGRSAPAGWPSGRCCRLVARAAACGKPSGSSALRMRNSWPRGPSDQQHPCSTAPDSPEAVHQQGPAPYLA